jgi:hypothetical protein
MATTSSHCWRSSRGTVWYVSPCHPLWLCLLRCMPCLLGAFSNCPLCVQLGPFLPSVWEQPGLSNPLPSALVLTLPVKGLACEWP